MDKKFRLLPLLSGMLLAVMLFVAVLPVSASVLQEDALALTSLSRTSAKVYTRHFKLNLEGTGFAAGAKVMWNAVELTPHKVKSNRIQVQISADLLALPGDVTVGVKNPGDILSNTLVFSVVSPRPQISKLDPRKADAESGGVGTFDVTISGHNFLPDASITWTDPLGVVTPLAHAAPCTRTRCVAQAPRTLLAEKGNPKIHVINGSVSSNPKTFTIQAPKPELASMNPATAVAGSLAPVTLTLTGDHFLPGSRVYWNGELLSHPATNPLNFIDSQHISLNIPAENLAAAGNFKVKVSNPGAGSSKSLVFTVTQAP